MSIFDRLFGRCYTEPTIEERILEMRVKGRLYSKQGAMYKKLGRTYKVMAELYERELQNQRKLGRIEDGIRDTEAGNPAGN